MLENEVESKLKSLVSTVTLPSRNSKGNTDGGRMQPTTALTNKIRGTSIASPEGFLSLSLVSNVNDHIHT